MKMTLFTVAAVAAIALGAGSAPASAVPNTHASCAAQLGAHGEMGSPGEYQRIFHDPTFGLRAVSFVATLEDCSE